MVKACLVILKITLSIRLRLVGGLAGVRAMD